MVRFRTRWFAPALLITVASAVQAQPAAPTGKRDPLNARAAVPLLVHESAFAQYRRLTDEKVTSWKEANDTVTRIGGWRFYAREAAQPDAPAPAASSPPSSTPTPADPNKPMPADHGGHKTN